ncbi:MAG TPA: nucleotidyl transferase AbiEii/AbiGii toxin family protein [Polyangiaceae bacterium]
MAPPTAAEAEQRLRESYALDLLWGETMGLPPGDTKEGALRQVISVLEAAHTAYALIGGVALQLHSKEPRTTLDIDLAVEKFSDVPADALRSAGFEHEARFLHSDNWRAPGAAPRTQRTAIQFSAEDVGIEAAVQHARAFEVDGMTLRVAMPADLVLLKLAAAEEPRQRAKKRRQDFLDIITLIEDYPEGRQRRPKPERAPRAPAQRHPDHPLKTTLFGATY